MIGRAVRVLGRIVLPIVCAIVSTPRVEAIAQHRASSECRASAILARSGKVFAIGSCLAVEIRKALSKAGYEFIPNIGTSHLIQTRSSLEICRSETRSLNDTFTIRQEIERALARTHLVSLKNPLT